MEVRMVGALGGWVRDGATATELEAWLDALDPPERKAAIERVSRDDQRTLYARVEGAPPLSPEHFVPAERGVLTPVVHHGWNSLPLPRPARAFRKVFARSEDGGRVFGYNDSPTRFLIGPGYFVLVADRDPPVVDYHEVPKGRVPSGWPWVRPNWVGLQVFVYYRTRDAMRRVSTHVSIGAATKFGRPLDHTFLLCREDR